MATKGQVVVQHITVIEANLENKLIKAIEHSVITKNTIVLSQNT